MSTVHTVACKANANANASGASAFTVEARIFLTVSVGARMCPVDRKIFLLLYIFMFLANIIISTGRHCSIVVKDWKRARCGMPHVCVYMRNDKRYSQHYRCSVPSSSSSAFTMYRDFGLRLRLRLAPVSASTQ